MALKIFDRLTVVAMRAALKEVRGFRRVVELGIDSYREVHGMPRLFSPQPDQPIETPPQHQSLFGAGDFLSVWIVEELALEQHVPISAETDLEQLAKDRGWVDDQGRFVMLPLAAARAMTAEQIEGILAPSVPVG